MPAPSVPGLCNPPGCPGKPSPSAKRNHSPSPSPCLLLPPPPPLLLLLLPLSSGPPAGAWRSPGPGGLGRRTRRCRRAGGTYPAPRPPHARTSWGRERAGRRRGRAAAGASTARSPRKWQQRPCTGAGRTERRRNHAGLWRCSTEPVTRAAPSPGRRLQHHKRMLCCTPPPRAERATARTEQSQHPAAPHSLSAGPAQPSPPT